MIYFSWVQPNGLYDSIKIECFDADNSSQTSYTGYASSFQNILNCSISDFYELEIRLTSYKKIGSFIYSNSQSIFYNSGKKILNFLATIKFNFLFI